MSSAAPQTQGTKSAPLARVMRPVNSLVERFIPSAFVFAVVLTFVVALAALLLTDAGPVDVLTGWGDGLSGLLAFMTQMALVLLLGYMLANTGPVRRLLERLAAGRREAINRLAPREDQRRRERRGQAQEQPPAERCSQLRAKLPGSPGNSSTVPWG